MVEQEMQGQNPLTSQLADQETDDPKYLTVEDLANFKQNLSEEIVSQVNQTVSGLAGRLKKDLSKQTETLFAEQSQQTKDVLAQFSPADKPEGEEQKSEPENLAEQLQQLTQWREQQTRLTNALQSELVKTKQKLSDAEAAAKMQRIKTQWLRDSGQSLHSPDQLLDLALNQGLVRVEGDRLVMPTSEVGLDGEYKNITGDSIPSELVKLPQFAHFKKQSRQGGTGAKIDGQANATGNSSIVEGFDLSKTQEEINAMYGREIRHFR